jgi:hypothetical protein
MSRPIVSRIRSASVTLSIPLSRIDDHGFSCHAFTFRNGKRKTHRGQECQDSSFRGIIWRDVQSDYRQGAERAAVGWRRHGNRFAFVTAIEPSLSERETLPCKSLYSWSCLAGFLPA